jgi:antirestriction protein ArdC
MRTNDLFERITRQIVTAIEAGAGEFIMPWHRWGESLGSPINALSGRSYRGINTLLLWVAAELDGYSSGRWATYRQWAAAGAQVRKGEKATSIIFWKTAANDCRDESSGEAEQSPGPKFVARVYHVFNAGQVDDAESAAAIVPSLSDAERIAAADAFFRASGVRVEHGGDRAFYMPSQDKIQMPRFEQFRDPISYYSVLGHEHIHSTGAEHRLNRDLQNRFGSDAYAIEELIAELGSAFLAAHLGISIEPRSDHAAYLSSWLRVLRCDSRAILTASAKAQEAVDFLIGLARAEQTDADDAFPRQAA